MVSKYVCLKPDDGSNSVWLIVDPLSGRVDATFLCEPSNSCRHIKLHTNVGCTYWSSPSVDYVLEKWQEFKEANK